MQQLLFAYKFTSGYLIIKLLSTRTMNNQYIFLKTKPMPVVLFICFKILLQTPVSKFLHFIAVNTFYIYQDSLLGGDTFKILFA